MPMPTTINKDGKRVIVYSDGSGIKKEQAVLDFNEAKDKLKKEGLLSQKQSDDWHSFQSKGNLRAGCFFVTGLKNINGNEIRNNYVVGVRGEATRDQLGGIKGKIPGVKCPDCGAQGFRTDHPGIASCGAYPGWFFWYLEEFEESDNDQKLIIKIVNGQPQLVPSTGKEAKEGGIK